MEKRFRTTITYAVFVTILILICFGCSKKSDSGKDTSAKRLSVVTTLFPLYDFAKNIAGSKADVQLLLPPGVEPHSFEPKPEDIVRISKADIFVYTNRNMETWAEKIIKSVDSQRLKVIDSGAGVNYITAVAVDSDGGHEDSKHSHNKHGQAATLDPHIWLDFSNSVKMVDNILAGFIAADPANVKYYTDNAAAFKDRLAALDKRYSEGLASCETRKILQGGHFTFGYLARRYKLDYHSLSGVSSESEPSAVKMAGMVRQIKKQGLKYIFAEELLSPRLSETLATEAGVAVLKLHGAHNLGRDDFQRGVTFIGLMEENLANLQRGMACRSK